MSSLKFQQGRISQEFAKSAFESEDFEQAYYFYIEAEKLYREAYEQGNFGLADRIFFMQSTALRCLEEIQDDRPDLFEAYRYKVESFLEEWTESKIFSKLKKPYQALLFRLWRESYFRGYHEFRAASIAERQGEWDKARQILDGVISRTESSTDSESDALNAIARSKQEIIAVHQELKKPEDQRNLRTVARSFLRAARVSKLPKGSRSRQRKQFDDFRARFLSQALKFQAFDSLRKQVSESPTSGLTKAERYLKKAIKLVKDEVHIIYLKYWHAVISERLCLMRFMVGGNDADFDLAVNAWRKALDAGKQLSARDGEDSIFPNRFYSIKDLELEILFLDAAKAFREQKWTDCIALLENWRQEFPKEYSWSWRDINIYIRLLGTKVILALQAKNSTEASTLCIELIKVSLAEPVGSAARYFADEIQHLPQKLLNQPLIKLVLDSLAQYFPLDSYVETYQRPSEIDPFASLPQRIYRGFRLLPPLDRTGVERLTAEFTGELEALLGYLCDYHAQIFSPTEIVPGPGLRSLLEYCGKFPFAAQASVKSTLLTLRTAVDQLQTAKNVQPFASAYDNARGALLRLLPFVPILIDIRSNTPRTEEPHAIEAFPNWVMGRPGRRELFIFARPEVSSSLKAGEYYLPPEWRKGNRVSYWVSDKHPLLPIRYDPRWTYWHSEIEMVKLGITTIFRQCVANYLLSKGNVVIQEHELEPGCPPIDIYWESKDASFIVETKFSFLGKLEDERALAQLRVGKDNAKRLAPHLIPHTILVTNADSLSLNIQNAIKSGNVELWVVGLKPVPNKILSDPRSMRIESIKGFSP